MAQLVAHELRSLRICWGNGLENLRTDLLPVSRPSTQNRRIQYDVAGQYYNGAHKWL